MFQKIKNHCMVPLFLMYLIGFIGVGVVSGSVLAGLIHPLASIVLVGGILGPIFRS